MRARSEKQYKSMILTLLLFLMILNHQNFASLAQLNRCCKIYPFIDHLHCLLKKVPTECKSHMHAHHVNILFVLWLSEHVIKYTASKTVSGNFTLNTQENIMSLYLIYNDSDWEGSTQLQFAFALKLTL